MPDSPITNFKDSNNVDLGKKLVTKDYLLEVYGSILENSPASGLIVTPELWGWGVQGEGRLGNNQMYSTVNIPVTTFAGGTNWKQISCGNSQMAAIKTDGSLWVWGFNGSGQLGTNDTTSRVTPVTTFTGENSWKQISCGREHTAAIKTDGSLWTWGAGADGALGNNNNTNRSTPVTTFAGGNDWKSVSAGAYNTAAIKTDGSLWVWGNNAAGKLGANISPDSIHRSTPITTFAGGNNWKQVSAGGGSGNTVAAVKTDGSLWTWGLNTTSGRLGINIGDNNFRFTPVTTFAGGNTWKFVSVGTQHTVAVKTDGTLWGWGTGTLNGNNSSSDALAPVTTFAGGTNWKSVSAGGNFTAAVKTDGTLWTWGNGGSGRLGTDDTTDKLTPVTTFAGGNNWKSASAGGDFAAAIQTIDYI